MSRGKISVRDQRRRVDTREYRGAEIRAEGCAHPAAPGAFQKKPGLSFSAEYTLSQIYCVWLENTDSQLQCSSIAPPVLLQSSSSAPPELLQCSSSAPPVLFSWLLSRLVAVLGFVHKLQEILETVHVCVWRWACFSLHSTFLAEQAHTQSVKLIIPSAAGQTQ